VTTVTEGLINAKERPAKQGPAPISPKHEGP